MTIRSFDLLRPRSLSEAVEMLAKHGDNARALGGGTTLVILMKQRALYYPYLVDLQTIPGLNEIKRERGRSAHWRSGDTSHGRMLHPDSRGVSGSR